MPAGHPCGGLLATRCKDRWRCNTSLPALSSGPSDMSEFALGDTGSGVRDGPGRGGNRPAVAPGSPLVGAGQAGKGPGAAGPGHAAEGLARKLRWGCMAATRTFADIALGALILRLGRRSRSSPEKPIWRPGMREKYASSKARKDAKKGDSFRIAHHPPETPSVGLQPGTA